jgi:hypothetical protein
MRAIFSNDRASLHNDEFRFDDIMNLIKRKAGIKKRR